MRTFKEICEELKDLDSNGPTVVHRTDIYGLYGILSSKKLKGSIYSYSIENGKEELCVLRKSVDSIVKRNQKRIEELSGGAAGGIKIYLYPKRITSSVRGTRIKPISEYNRVDMKEKEKYLTKLLKNCIINDKKTIKKVLEDFFKSADWKENSKRTKDFYSYFYNKYINKNLVNEDQIKYLLSSYFSFSQTLKKNSGTKNREGEERISFRKENKIPLNKLLMRIRIEREITFEDLEEDDLEEYEHERLEKLVNKYDFYFCSWR